MIKNTNDLIDAVIDRDGCIIFGKGRVGRLIGDDLEFISIEDVLHKEILYAVSDKEHLNEFYVECDSAPVAVPVVTISEALAQNPTFIVIIATIIPDLKQEMISICERLGADHVEVDIRYLASKKEQVMATTRLVGLERKLSMVDDIWQNDDTKFYVPNYPRDYLQRWIVDKHQFYEEDILKQLDRYLDSRSVIFDIGANIGNHSLYWAKKTHVRKIYAFEPVLSTYTILKKNIVINHLEDLITPFDFGLSDQDGNAGILTYALDSIGSTRLQQKEDGELAVHCLDSLPLADQLERVDFVKIDVEGFESRVLRGGSKFFQRFRPTVFIESFPDMFPETNRILKDYGYARVRQVDMINHIYQPLDRL